MNQNVAKIGTPAPGNLETTRRQPARQRGAGHRRAGGSASSRVAWWSSRADYGLLYGKLSDAEAAKVIAALDDAKVPYKIGSGGSSILVPGGQGLPHADATRRARAFRAGDGVGFEIFDKPNFGISDFVQRANYIRAVAGRTGPHHRADRRGRERPRDDRAAGKPAAARQGQTPDRLGLRPRARQHPARTRRPSIPSASSSPIPSRASSRTSSPWWTTSATCSPRTSTTIRSSA